MNGEFLQVEHTRQLELNNLFLTLLFLMQDKIIIDLQIQHI
jgi:hypothetical protein